MNQKISSTFPENTVRTYVRLSGIFKWAFAVLAILCIAACQPSSPHPSDTGLPEKAWLLPTTWEKSNNAETQQVAYYDFIWRSFIAVNWPNVPIQIEDGEIVSGYRGQPVADENAIREQSGNGPLKYFSVWETYREPSEIFPQRTSWNPYPAWNSVAPDKISAEGTYHKRFKGYFEGILEYATEINQPDFAPDPTGPLMDQDSNYVRYEVTVNEAFFTYIKHFQYYNARAQQKAVATYVSNPTGTQNGFQRPPHGTPDQFETGYLKDLPAFARQGLVDVKAAWRVLEPGRGHLPERYLHREIVINEKGDKKLMGLVALHILRFTPDGYVASTFEQVDNVAVDAGAPEGVKPSFNTGAAPTELQQRLGFEGPFPAAIKRGASPPPKDKRSPVSVYRVSPLLPAVRDINKEYQKKLEGTVFQYYKLIGTQNKHPGDPLHISFKDSTSRAKNGHEGPLTGVYTNTNNLINTALESYTQLNHSCIQCHVRARPKGVPTQAKEVDHFKILTFLLQVADTLPLAPEAREGDLSSLQKKSTYVKNLTDE